MKFLRQIFSIIPMSASFYNKMLQEKIILSRNIFILLKIEYFSLWAYNVSTLISYGICTEFMWNSLFSVATKFFLWVWVLWYWWVTYLDTYWVNFEVCPLCKVNLIFFLFFWNSATGSCLTGSLLSTWPSKLLTFAFWHNCVLFSRLYLYLCLSPPIELRFAVNE